MKYREPSCSTAATSVVPTPSFNPRFEGGCDHPLIGFAGAAFERGRNALVGSLARIGVENGADRGLAGHIAVLHAAHAIAQDRQEASVSQEGVVFRVRQTYGILLVVASSDVLRVGRQVAHRKRSIITCLRSAQYGWSDEVLGLDFHESGVRMGLVMGSLSPRLQVRVSQKQILTPGLVQMVSLLQLNRLELKDMISAEVAQNPVLEEATEGGEELTPEELQPLLEAEGERSGDPADQSILEVTAGPAEVDGSDGEFEPAWRESVSSLDGRRADGVGPDDSGSRPAARAGRSEIPETKAADPFDEIDFGSYFDDYLDPGYKSPASEISEKPSFETFLSSPVTLSDHLHSQLALIALTEDVRDAAEGIIGNLDENGYLTVDAGGDRRRGGPRSGG